MSIVERERRRERGKSHWNLHMYCNFCRACNITWLLLIKSSESIVSDKSSDVLDGVFCILSLSSQYIMEWWMKLLPLFCVILLSLGWWGDLSVPTLFFFWSRQKSDTNMKKNSAWPWIRRIRCVSSFHRCKSWIITDEKLKNRILIILDNLCSNSKRIWGFFLGFWKTFIFRKSSLILLNVFVL